MSRHGWRRFSGSDAVGGHARQPHVVVGAAVAVFLATGVMPLVYMLAAAIGDVSLGVLWLDARQRVFLSNSAVLAIASAALATMIGAPLGFGLARVRVAKAVLRVALATPVLLPPYVVALAWVYLGGSAGAPPRGRACSPAGRIACPPQR